MRTLVVRALLIALAVSGCARVQSQNQSEGSSALGGGIRLVTAPPAGTSGRNPALVSTILETRCASCHGPGTAAYGGIDYISDLSQLIAHRKVIPGNPTGSPVFHMACGKGPCGPAIPAAEIQEISDWISGLAVNEPAQPRRHHRR